MQDDRGKNYYASPVICSGAAGHNRSSVFAPLGRDSGPKTLQNIGLSHFVAIP
jgi:hypothetical protein